MTEAIQFFTDCLRFDLVEDTPLGGGKRWVIVAPARWAGSIPLAGKGIRGSNNWHGSGTRPGERVFLFLRTEDFHGDYRVYEGEGGSGPQREPRQERLMARSWSSWTFTAGKSDLVQASLGLQASIHIWRFPCTFDLEETAMQKTQNKFSIIQRWDGMSREEKTGKVLLTLHYSWVHLCV